MQKTRFDLRISPDLRHQLDAQVGDSGNLTKLIERYLEEGIARDNGELIEQSSLPAIRAAVREEVGKAMQELYQQLSSDLQKSARRSDDRLAALIVKAARGSGISWRIIYSLASKLVTPDFATRVLDDAREKVGKEIAKPES